MKLRLNAVLAAALALACAAPALAQTATPGTLNIRDASGAIVGTCEYTQGGLISACSLEMGLGTDGALHPIVTDASGHQVISVTGTVPVSVASLPLPTNAAAETGGNLAAVAASDATTATNTGRIPVAGQAVMAASTPVTIASNQSAVPVTGSGTFAISASALPLPSGAATASAQPALNGDGGALAHVTNFPSTQAVSWSGQSVSLTGTLPAFASTPAFTISGSLPAFASTPTVTANAGTNLNTSALALDTSIGDPGAVACSTDTASCSLNQQLQRNNQRLTSVITALGSPFQAGASIGNSSFGATESGSWTVTANAGSGTFAISASALPLPIGAAVETGGNLATTATNTATTNTDFGAPGAAACASDTASCSLNQQMQRVAQRLTTINTALASPFQAGGSIGNTSFAATESGTWTLQPGNTANTTPWLFTMSQGGNTAIVSAAGAQKVDGSAVTQPTTLAPTSSSTAAIAPVVSTALEASHVLKAGAGNLYSVSVTTSATGGYLMVFNTTSAPADGAVTPAECIPVGPYAIGSIAFAGQPPESYATGITAVFSSTGCLTKTGSATGFFHGSIQ